MSTTHANASGVVMRIALLRSTPVSPGLLAVLVCTLIGCSTADPVVIDRGEPKVVFIIVDGIPADVLETAPTPFIDELAGETGYARAYVGGEPGGASESPTVSAVGYNSLLTGAWANKHNGYSNAIEAPDYRYWDIFRIAKQQNASIRTALFSSWEDNRTKLIGEGLPEAGGQKLNYYFDGFENDEERFPHDEARQFIREIDALVSDEAASYISREGPDLSWVYLEFTDDIGHMFGDGDELNSAVTLMDANVGKIWQAAMQRQVLYEEDWLILVTTDHGRDTDTGKNHGGQSERERTIWIASDSERLNRNFYNMPGIVDVLPSLLTHLEVAVPAEIRDQLDGETFIDRAGNSTATD